MNAEHMQVLLRSPAAAPLVPRPASATSARAESLALPEPEASEDAAPEEASQDAQRASKRIRLRGAAPRRWYGDDESPPYSSHGPKSKASMGVPSGKAPHRPGRFTTQDSGNPSSSQPGSGGSQMEVAEQREDGAQSERARQTRLRVKPLSRID